MTKTEIVEHPDFVKLVKAAVSEYRLKRSMDRLGIDIEELVHLVRCYIWRRNIRENVALSTVVFNFTRYTIKDELSMKFGLYGRRKHGVIQAAEEEIYRRVECHRSNGAVPLEYTQIIDKLRNMGFGNEIDLCIKFESRYKGHEVAAQIGKKITRQGTEQMKRRAYRVLRSAVDSMGICDE